MAHTLETKISSPSTIIKIITDVSSSEAEKNSNDVNNTSKEFEKGDREHQESSSTQTSSSSSLLHKKKSHCYYVHNNRIYKPPNNYAYALLNRSKRNTNTTTQKIISAKFLRVKQLQSEISEAQKKISDLQEENRTLRNIQVRQDSALKKFQSQESHLPHLMKSHEEELRVITLKYKKLRSAHNELESRHKKQYTELMNIKDRYKHLLQISQDKHLLQREQLTKQIEEMKTVINDLKNKIKLQSRRLDLEAKNFKYQLSIEFGKQKNLQEQLKQSQDTIRKLQIEIKDKDRYMANCKINQHVSNKVNHLRFKIPVNSEKTISRFCSTYGENQSNRISSSDDKHLNEKFSSDSAHKQSTFCKTSDDSDDDLVSKPNFVDQSIGEKDRKPYSFENGSLPSINQSNSFYTDSKSNSSEIKSPFSSYFELDYLSKSNQNLRSTSGITNKNNSDDNNNVKRRFSFDNETPVRKLDEQKIKMTSPNTNSAINNFCNELLAKEDNFEQNDTSSEKSDELKGLDETVSWLEFHEKFNNQSEYVETEVQLRKKSDIKDAEATSDDSLPYDKKSALLSVLREIDLEKNDNTTITLASPIKLNNVAEKVDGRTKTNKKFTLNSQSLKKSI